MTMESPADKNVLDIILNKASRCTRIKELHDRLRLLLYYENLIRHYPNIRSSADEPKVVHQMMT